MDSSGESYRKIWSDGKEKSFLFRMGLRIRMKCWRSRNSSNREFKACCEETFKGNVVN